MEPFCAGKMDAHKKYTGNQLQTDKQRKEAARSQRFQKEAAREVDMSQYFQTNQFQSGKIVIDYNYGDLQWNDMLYWAIEVEGNTSLKVTIDFYPAED